MPSRPAAAPSRATTACRHAATGGRRDRPAGAVPHHARRPAHHRADDARQPRRARQLRLIFLLRPELNGVTLRSATVGRKRDDSTRTSDPQLLLRHRCRRAVPDRHRAGAGSRGRRLRLRLRDGPLLPAAGAGHPGPADAGGLHRAGRRWRPRPSACSWARWSPATPTATRRCWPRPSPRWTW